MVSVTTSTETTVTVVSDGVARAAFDAENKRKLQGLSEDAAKADNPAAPAVLAPAGASAAGVAPAVTPPAETRPAIGIERAVANLSAENNAPSAASLSLAKRLMLERDSASGAGANAGHIVAPDPAPAPGAIQAPTPSAKPAPETEAPARKSFLDILAGDALKDDHDDKKPRPQFYAGSKSVDSSVDDFNVLKRFSKVDEENKPKRIDPKTWGGSSRSPLGDKTKPMTTDFLDWQSRYVKWGMKRSSSMGTDDTVAHKAYETPSLREHKSYGGAGFSTLNGTRNARGNADPLQYGKAAGFLSDSTHSYGERHEPYKNYVRGFSMMDINRYQFRSSRSTDPGLPTVRPGGEVTTQNIGLGN